jgi:hypothetical protein
MVYPILNQGLSDKQYSFGGKSLGRTIVMMFGKTMVNKMGQRNLLWG